MTALTYPSWLPTPDLYPEPSDFALIERSYQLVQAHNGTMGKRTQSLIPLLMHMRGDATLIAAGLLVRMWREKRLSAEQITETVGEAVVDLLRALDQLALIDQLHDQEKSDLEQLRKMLLAMASDMRAVILKLALQLSLMRHMDDLPLAEQQRFALQTRDIFAPLANRLGIAQFKWELEDRALRTLEPDIYQEISDELEGNREDRERYIERIIQTLREEMNSAGVVVNKIYGRVKHINSIYLKMKRKGLKFEELNDIRAVRIETQTEDDCYKALAIVDSLWTPIPKEFDDYISNPKANGYQSLHSSFIGPDNRVIEVQIRTTDMHNHAELGVAAHWLYKEKGARHSKQFEQQIEWLRRMISGGDQKRGDVVFDQFKNEAFRDRVYAISPQGRVVDLPEGSTPLDFAYHIHTQLGHRCKGAKVNGQMVPLTSALKNGDSVEILTHKEPNPSRDWLNDHLGYLQSGRAKAKVKSYFKKLEKESSVLAGQEMLERECKRLSIEIMGLEEIAQRFNQHSVADLYAVIGFGDVGVLSVAHEIAARQQKQEEPLSLDERLARMPVKRARKNKQPMVEIEGVDDMLVNYATCCQPAPPSPITGFITLGRGVNIHRADCHNVLHLQKVHPERMLDVRWNKQAAGVFNVDLAIDAYDLSPLLREISQVLSNEKIPMTRAKMQADRRLGGIFSVEISDMEQLSRAIDRLSQIKGVLAVRRIQY